MPKDAKTGVEELDPTNTEGDDSDGAADQERTVPLSVVKALRKSNEALKTQLARVEGTVDGLKAGQPKPQADPKLWTRGELRAKVNAGEITEDHMDQVLADQMRKEIKREVDGTIDARVSGAKSEAVIEAEIDRYIDAFPDVNEEGSDTREKVAAQFKKLVGRGFPKNLSTELTAMEMALGALGGTSKGRKKAPESHDETGTGGGRPAQPDDDGLFKGVPAKTKAYYQKQIDRGFYKGAAGQKTLKAELDLARARH